MMRYVRVALAAALAVVSSAAAAQSALHWVHSGTGAPLPPDAYIGGVEDGQGLVVCRAPYRGGVYPGKVVKGNCNIAYDSRELYIHEFDVLAGQGGVWGPPRPDYGGALIAGYENGGPLFLCQAPYRGGVHPGKIYHGRCNISYAGSEIPRDRFATLQVADPVAYGDFRYPGAPGFFYGGPAYPPPPPYRDRDADRRQAALDAQQRQLDAQRAANEQRARDLRDQQDADRRRAEFQRNMDAEARAADDRRRATLMAQQRALDDAAAARQRAEGEAEENRMALQAQAKADAEARQQAEEAARQAEIKRGEEEENRMAAEAQAKAEAEAEAKQQAEDAARQAEIRRGEEEENRMAAEAAKNAEPAPPQEQPPRGEPQPDPQSCP